jgi:hypothetical protein
MTKFCGLGLVAHARGRRLSSLKAFVYFSVINLLISAIFVGMIVFSLQIISWELV